MQAFKSALEYSLSVQANGTAARILDISDGGWGACLAGALGATNVISIESASGELATMAARIAQCGNGLPLKADGVTGKFDIILGHLEHLTLNDLWGQPPDIIIADYYNFFEEWHLQESLNLFYKCRSLRRRNIISDQTMVLPCSFRVMACVVENEQLRSSYSSGSDENGRNLGLDPSYLKKFAGNFSFYDLSIPLFWQYDYTELSDVFEMHSFGTEPSISYDNVNVCKKETFKSAGSVDAVVFWIEYAFPKSGVTFSTGNNNPYNQLVRMLPPPRMNISESDLENFVISIEFTCGGLASPRTHEL